MRLASAAVGSSSDAALRVRTDEQQFTLSDLLAVERDYIARGGRLGVPSSREPTLEELRKLHTRMMTQRETGVAEDWEALARAKKLRAASADGASERAIMLQRVANANPTRLRQHGTAIQVSRQQHQREAQQQQPPPPQQRPPQQQHAKPRQQQQPSQQQQEDIEDASRPGSPSSRPPSRTVGSAMYSNLQARSHPSGFRQSLRFAHAHGGRLSAVSIPSSASSHNNTQGRLDDLREQAATAGEQFHMLDPSTYHAVHALLSQQRAVLGAAEYEAALEAEEAELLHASQMHAGAPLSHERSGAALHAFGGSGGSSSALLGGSPPGAKPRPNTSPERAGFDAAVLGAVYGRSASPPSLPPRRCATAAAMCRSASAGVLAGAGAGAGATRPPWQRFSHSHALAARLQQQRQEEHEAPSPPRRPRYAQGSSGSPSGRSAAGSPTKAPSQAGGASSPSKKGAEAAALPPSQPAADGSGRGSGRGAGAGAGGGGAGSASGSSLQPPAHPLPAHPMTTPALCTQQRATSPPRGASDPAYGPLAPAVGACSVGQLAAGHLPSGGAAGTHRGATPVAGCPRRSASAAQLPNAGGSRGHDRPKNAPPLPHVPPPFGAIVPPPPPFGVTYTGLSPPPNSSEQKRRPSITTPGLEPSTSYSRQGSARRPGSSASQGRPGSSAGRAGSGMGSAKPARGGTPPRMSSAGRSHTPFEHFPPPPGALPQPVDAVVLRTRHATPAEPRADQFEDAFPPPPPSHPHAALLLGPDSSCIDPSPAPGTPAPALLPITPASAATAASLRPTGAAVGAQHGASSGAGGWAADGAPLCSWADASWPTAPPAGAAEAPSASQRIWPEGWSAPGPTHGNSDSPTRSPTRQPSRQGAAAASNHRKARGGTAPVPTSSKSSQSSLGLSTPSMANTSHPAYAKQAEGAASAAAYAPRTPTPCAAITPHATRGAPTPTAGTRPERQGSRGQLERPGGAAGGATGSDHGPEYAQWQATHGAQAMRLLEPERAAPSKPWAVRHLAGSVAAELADLKGARNERSGGGCASGGGASGGGGATADPSRAASRTGTSHGASRAAASLAASRSISRGATPAASLAAGGAEAFGGSSSLAPGGGSRRPSRAQPRCGSPPRAAQCAIDLEPSGRETSAPSIPRPGTAPAAGGLIMTATGATAAMPQHVIVPKPRKPKESTWEYA